MNESWRTHTKESRHTNMNDPWHHIWMTHGTHMNESCHTHMNDSWHTHEKIIAHTYEWLMARTHTYTYASGGTEWTSPRSSSVSCAFTTSMAPTVPGAVVARRCACVAACCSVLCVLCFHKIYGPYGTWCGGQYMSSCVGVNICKKTFLYICIYIYLYIYVCFIDVCMCVHHMHVCM